MYVLVTSLGLDLFSGTYVNKLLFLLCPVIENNSVQRVHQVLLSMKMEKEPVPETSCGFKKTDDRQSHKKEDYVT